LMQQRDPGQPSVAGTDRVFHPGRGGYESLQVCLTVRGNFDTGKPDEEGIDVCRVARNSPFGADKGRRACSAERVENDVALARLAQQFLDLVDRVGWRQT